MTAADVVVLAGEPNHGLSWAIGGLALLILLGLMAALVVFGGGREHS